MRPLVILLFLIFEIVTYGQSEENILKSKDSGVIGNNRQLQDDKYKISDTIPVVHYMKNDSIKNSFTPTYYLNGKEINSSILCCVNPQIIDSIKVAKNSDTVDKMNQNGEIFIKTKENYKLSLISLNNLAEKYLKLNNNSVLFMIDNRIINEDYSKYIIDEKFIAKIEVEYIKRSVSGVDINIVKLITRTEENLKKLNAISIR